MKTVLVVNGSLGGSTGNTGELLAFAEEHLASSCRVAHLELIREPSMDRILAELQRADGFLFGTGTYWDSWGSPLQRFFEMVAHTEGQNEWCGKPACAIVTGHAAGAKGVLSRLFGVLNVFGVWLPPMAGMTYSYVDHVALPYANEHLLRELWTVSDVEVICHNLLTALEGRHDWHRWPSNQGRSSKKWLHCYTERPGDSTSG